MPELPIFDSFTFWLIVLAMLIAYLWFSIERRRFAEEARCLAREKEERERWQAEMKYTPGVSFDVSAIAPQIQKLREDHLAALHHQPHETYYRRGLIAAFRQTVKDLAFFHPERSEQEMSKTDVAHY
ncbi:MAG TPA: hypothetical protein VGR14_12545 [Verrucomicrobiae bacterium]|jgi:hypothetical protein|nr:hypothetical protein [Verrucomicrobiae bacterium]